MPLSNSRIDALGRKLRANAALDPEDEELLEEFLLQRDEALQAVVRQLRSIRYQGQPLLPSSRVETLATTREKLQRESTRLSQIQDIAGARIVVDGGLIEQDEVCAAIQSAFPDSRLIDRRERPSHGYRAVHVVVRQEGIPVEVQVRTPDQHRWAELLERLADTLGRQIRYGGPPVEPDADFFGMTQAEVLRIMMNLSDIIGTKESGLARLEIAKRDYATLQSRMSAHESVDPEFEQLSRNAEDVLRRLEGEIRNLTPTTDAMLDALARLVEPKS